jgi:hypothetical protein
MLVDLGCESERMKRNLESTKIKAEKMVSNN